MKPVTIHYKLSLRLMYLLASLGILTGVVILLVALLPFPIKDLWQWNTRGLDPFTDTTMRLSLAVIVCMPAMLLLGVLPIVYVGLYMWNYRLEFGETYFEARGIYHPLARLPKLAYRNIVKVQRGAGRGSGRGEAGRVRPAGVRRAAGHRHGPPRLAAPGAPCRARRGARISRERETSREGSRLDRRPTACIRPHRPLADLDT